MTNPLQAGVDDHAELLPQLDVTRSETMRITLCGSTKFRDEYELWNKRLTLAGFLVYSVSGFGHSGDVFTDEEKAQLDRVHLAKIDASHAIVVIDVGGYIGASTRREIDHAKATGKAVYYVSGDPTVYRLRVGEGEWAGTMRDRAFNYRAAPVLPDRGWRPISDFVGFGQNNPAIVAAPYVKDDGSRSWIVGEAYRVEPERDEEPDWWWANTGPGDYTGDPIGSMGYGGPLYFQPLPDAPAEGAE